MTKMRQSHALRNYFTLSLIISAFSFITNLAAQNNQLFVSSNTSGTIGSFVIASDNTITESSFMSAALDADGIHYDTANDVLYQLNRTDNRVDIYSNGSTNPTLVASSSSDFTNGREIAVVGNKLVVAEDVTDANRLLVYDITTTSITLDKIFDVDINTWGIHANGNQLIAIVDNSSDVAVYDNFFNQPEGELAADAVITIEDMVRTHGITYDAETDNMYLTDVGQASSDNDGALVRIQNWTEAIADGTVSAAEQARVSGGSSLLGNPVDIALDTSNNRIYVAERARNGGMVLGFKNIVLTGGIAPTYAETFAGASAVFLTGVETPLNTCDFVTGGTVALLDGNTTKTIIVDGTADEIDFMSSVDPAAGGFSFTYVVTDDAGMVLGLPGAGPVDFDPAGLGACNVYGLSYTGNLTLAAGDNLFGGQDLSDACFEISSNNIIISRIEPSNVRAQLFASSNNSGQIGVFSILNNDMLLDDEFASEAMDADGIHYDVENDVLYQLNRSMSVVNIYSGVNAALQAGSTPTLVATSTSDFTNGREIAVSGNKLVVADDVTDANKFVVYDITASTITLDKVLDADINLWGIQFNGDQLIAIEDNSPNVAIYEDFLSQPAGPIVADASVLIENMVRTHGLTYDAASDFMVLTDVGEASSAGDGALFTVENWTAAIADGTVSESEAIRVAGGTSLLGNPVDVALDKSTGIIYVAERARDGGRILGFRNPAASGGIAPIYNHLFPGASAVNLMDVVIGLEPCFGIEGGFVTITDGNTEVTTINDGNPDFLEFATDFDATAAGALYTYVITDDAGMVLGTPAMGLVDFDPAGVGVCEVYGLAYTGTLTVEQGDDLFGGQDLSDDCFSLSDNSVTVTRINAPGAVEAELFISSNTQALVGTYDIYDEGTIIPGAFSIPTTDADGIYYDDANDVLYQLNRTNNTVDIYNNVSSGAPAFVASSTADFTNGREIAVSGNKLVVADDVTDANRFIVYDITTSTISLDKILDADINLWGIHAVGDDLIAVVDNSSDVAIYEDFFLQPAGAIVPTQVITIENMVRTHGLDYDLTDDILILTDVGAASSATDGALVVVRNFMQVGADGVVTEAEQVRAFGGADFLGNPVDVAYDKQNARIYVAERANGGGRILGFLLPKASGGIAPFYNRLFAGASAVFIPEGPCDVVPASTVTFADGSSIQTVTVDDGMADVLSFITDADIVNYSQTYVITDATGMVLGVPGGDNADFETAGLGACRVYSVSYTGNFVLTAGQNINTAQLSDDCARVSQNFALVLRVSGFTGGDDAETRADTEVLTTAAVYPNPATTTLSIGVESNSEVEGLIRIFDATGKVLMSRGVSLLSGQNTMTFEVNELQTGMYFVQVPGSEKVIKFMKSNN